MNQDIDNIDESHRDVSSKQTSLSIHQQFKKNLSSLENKSEKSGEASSFLQSLRNEPLRKIESCIPNDSNITENACLPPIIPKLRYKDHQGFPTIGRVNMSTKRHQSPYSSMHKNKITLENNLRGKINSGEANIDQKADTETQEKTKNRNHSYSVDATCFKKNLSLRRTERNKEPLIVNEDISLDGTPKRKRRINKAQQTKRKQIVNMSLINPVTNRLPEETDMDRYKEVRNSVEKYIKKFSHLIPNLKKKKYELLTDILGKDKYEEIKSKLKSKNPAKEAKSRDRMQRPLGSLKINKTTDGSPKNNIKRQKKAELLLDSSAKSKMPKQKPESKEELVTYKGAITDKYINLGGLGFNKDKSWDVAHERRRNMLNFSHKVNESQLNKGNSSSLIRQKSLKERNEVLKTLRQRRNKALDYAKHIKKPNPPTNPISQPEQRFIKYDNKEYLLENQKIKMLFF
ncbi:unnamed protein product [Moneuplotes crassus]|uniref:Uncharacterized protein n=1 Tax=Euplotes crassus TaxID=5936 RepID=A0AAD1UEA7_EUPCR|nr:unnamed protein product [Moneuplotes crassus]